MKVKSQVLSIVLLAGALLAIPARAADIEFNIPPSEEIIADELVASGPTIAESGEGKDECGGRSPLTDAQLEKFAALKDQFELSTASKKAELRSLFRQMRDSMTQPTIDRQKITSLHDRMNSLRTDLSNARLSFAMDRAEVLTPEQRARIHHMMLLHQFGHGGWHHHGSADHSWGGHGPGRHEHGGHDHDGPEHGGHDHRPGSERGA